jgi:hypothetical protein
MVHEHHEYLSRVSLVDYAGEHVDSILDRKTATRLDESNGSFRELEAEAGGNGDASTREEFAIGSSREIVAGVGVVFLGW